MTDRLRGSHFGVAALVMLALLLRGGLILWDGARLHSDPDTYVQLARSLAAGDGFVVGDPPRPTAFRPVLYPLLLSGPLSMGIPAVVTVAAFNLLASAILVLLVFQLTLICGGSRTSAYAASLLLTLDPLLLRYTTEPMTEVVCAALLCAAVLAVLHYSRRLPPKKTLSWKTAVAAGVLLGLCVLCRPVVLVLCIALPILLWWQTRPAAAARGWKPHLFLVFLPSLTAAVTVSPWILRNAVHFQALVPATTHGGYTLLLGNNSVFYDRVVSGQQRVWDGASLTAWQADINQQLVDSGVDPADERAADRWMYQRASREMSARPAAACAAIWLKWKRFWGVVPSTGSDTLPSVLLTAVGIWYVGLFVGLLSALCATPRHPQLALLWLTVASFFVVHSFYWTNTRMRAPLTGLLVVLSVFGWVWLSQRISPFASTKTVADTSSRAAGS